MSTSTDWVKMQLSDFAIAVPENQVARIDFVDPGKIGDTEHVHCLGSNLVEDIAERAERRRVAWLAGSSTTFGLLCREVDILASDVVAIFEVPDVLSYAGSPFTGIGVSADGKLIGLTAADRLEGFLSER